MMKKALLFAAMLTVLPVSAHAQSTRCDRMPTEEEYQRCIEREGSKQPDFDPRDIGIGAPRQTEAPQTQPNQEAQAPEDTLPPASRRQVQKQMAKQVYAKVGDWTPEARDQEFDYEPSEAAKSDAELRAQEEAAFAEAVENYHNREQKAFEAAQGGGQGDEAGEKGGGGGNGEDSGQGSGGGNIAVRGQTRDSGNPGQGAGGQSRSAIEILGDLTATGDGQPGDQSGGSSGADGAEGKVQIAGDVTIDRDAGAGVAGASGGASGSASEDAASGSAGGGAGEQQAGASGAGGAQQGQGAGAPGEQAAGAQAGAAGQEQADQTGQAGQAGSTPPQQTADASGGGGSGDEAASGPPPSPPRPIPSAESIAAEMLAKLFEDQEEPEDIPFSDAPFEDWSDPDPVEAPGDAAAEAALADAAEAVSAAEPQPPSAPSGQPEVLQRQIDKEEARVAVASQQGGNPDDARLERLKAAQAGATGSGQGAVSAEAARRLSVMELP